MALVFTHIEKMSYSRASHNAAFGPPADVALCKSVLFKVQCFSTVQVILSALIQGFSTVQVILTVLIQEFSTVHVFLSVLIHGSALCKNFHQCYTKFSTVRGSIVQGPSVVL